MSTNCVISDANRATTLTITGTECYIPAVTFSTQDNTKLSQELKSGFKGSINWNKHQLKVPMKAQNYYLDYLLDSSFQGVYQLTSNFKIIVILFHNCKFIFDLIYHQYKITQYNNDKIVRFKT